ncbi:type IV pilus modification protein PilV [Methylophaga sp. 41_12_T18]|nr:type IV pilus modification protein PilV [Methylophaga sp. 41_12_T18]
MEKSWPGSQAQSGFTLLEVLISLVILSIGLLGLAGIQATSLKDNHTAYNRSQATQLTYDITDRMRANKVAIDNYLTSFMASTAATAQAGCLIAGCTATEMAQHDLYEWQTAFIDILPSGRNTITKAGDTYTVMLSWDEDRDGDNTNDPEFQASFQP